MQATLTLCFVSAGRQECRPPLLCLQYVKAIRAVNIECSNFSDAGLSLSTSIKSSFVLFFFAFYHYEMQVLKMQSADF